MSSRMCLQTFSSTVKLKWNAEFLMPECFYPSAVSLCGDSLQSSRSVWERDSGSSNKGPIRHLVPPLVSGNGMCPHTQTLSWDEARIFIISSGCRHRHERSAAPVLSGLSSDSDHEREDEDGAESEDCNNSEDITTNTSSDSSQGEEDTGISSV